jgi:hypothetical protein
MQGMVLITLGQKPALSGTRPAPPDASVPVDGRHEVLRTA